MKKIKINDQSDDFDLSSTNLYLRPLLLVELDCHECGGGLLRHVGVGALPEEVRAPLTTHCRVPGLAPAQISACEKRWDFELIDSDCLTRDKFNSM